MSLDTDMEKASPLGCRFADLISLCHGSLRTQSDITLSLLKGSAVGRHKSKAGALVFVPSMETVECAKWRTSYVRSLKH